MPSSSKGFTLVELMIVVVVIGILAAIAIPNYILMQDRAKEGSTKSNMHTVQLAAEDYGIQNEGVYPDVMDTGHLVPQLPPNFRNPFNAANDAWENRDVFAGTAAATPGITSYADSGTTVYNVKAYGKAAPLYLVLTSGR